MRTPSKKRRRLRPNKSRKIKVAARTGPHKKPIWEPCFLDHPLYDPQPPLLIRW